MYRRHLNKDEKAQIKADSELENAGSNKKGGIDKGNNRLDPYGYDFVPTLPHWTNIDEQRKQVKKIEDMTED